MLRRLHKEQPASFAFTPANLEWAQGQISKYPEGRQASAIIPLLFRAQQQDGWLTRAAIQYVADMLGMAHIRALEVATFYFMFQLQPTGSVAHIQICGTTSCMICGAEDLIAVCKEMISAQPFTVSPDGKFSWEEVECLGACANAPMAQIGKDNYEDLTAEKLRELITRFSNGEVPVPGSQIGRYASEPASGLTSLKEYDSGRTQYNASVQLAVDIGDTVKRIDGTEVPNLTPWRQKAEVTASAAAETTPSPAAGGIAPQTAEALTAKPEASPAPVGGVAVAAPGQPVAEGAQPAALDAPRNGAADDLQVIEGIGPKLEALCHELGIWHFDQIAAWGVAEISWMDSNLAGFKGRVTRDKWVSQAKIIVEQGLEEFKRRAATNDY